MSRNLSFVQTIACPWRSSQTGTRCTGIAALQGLVAALAIGFPLLKVGAPVGKENGVLEIIQVMLLALAGGMMAWRFRDHSLSRPILALGSLFFLTLALRELDLRETSAPAWLVDATFHQRHLWLNPLWVGVLTWAIVQRKQIAAALPNQPVRQMLRPAIPLMVVFAASSILEDQAFGMAKASAQFMEEALEVGFATGLLSLALEFVASLRD